MRLESLSMYACVIVYLYIYRHIYFSFYIPLCINMPFPVFSQAFLYVCSFLRPNKIQPIPSDWTDIVGKAKFNVHVLLITMLIPLLKTWIRDFMPGHLALKPAICIRPYHFISDTSTTIELIKSLMTFIETGKED